MKNPGEFVLSLFNARTVAHVQHLQTNSYARHIALNEFYDGLIPLADSFAEAYQGCFGLIEFKATSYRLEKDPIRFLESIKALVLGARAELADQPSLQNILDEIVNLTSQALYKIGHLS